MPTVIFPLLQQFTTTATANGAALPEGGPQVFLTDTLESPNITPDFPSLMHKELTQQHKRALEIKALRPVLICIGNPPYDRHHTATEATRKETGGWVRWGDEDENGKSQPEQAILQDFIQPVREVGEGGQLKNIYNLYVYFWRWALWKVFECGSAQGPGIVSFITAASYLYGPAFGGMRERMRRLCDEIYILDLGGEGQGTRREENVFEILTPVSIAIAVRYNAANTGVPAKVNYTRIRGGKNGKLEQLAAVENLKSLKWTVCPNEWGAPFKPAGRGQFFKWPKLADLMPWQLSGVKAGRTWVMSYDEMILEQRWERLCSCSVAEKTVAFKNSPTGKKTTQTPVGLHGHSRLKAIAELASGADHEPILRYGYRSFDRQFIVADARCIDRPSPSLFAVHGKNQVYFTTLSTQPLDLGPAVTMTPYLPDLHHFRGSYGAGDIIPLYRDSGSSVANIAPELLNFLESHYGHSVEPDGFAAYLYGITAHPAFTEHFYSELESKDIRIPLTKDYSKFESVSALGRKLIWLHSFSERMTPEGGAFGKIPAGKAKCAVGVSERADSYPDSYSYDSATSTLSIGSGVFSPVAQELVELKVSGFPVLDSWLKNRLGKGAGKKSSPLDSLRSTTWTSSYTKELLTLLWILEATIETYPAQLSALNAVIEGPCFLAEELPEVPEEARQAPEEHDGRKKKQKQVKFVLPTGDTPGVG